MANFQITKLIDATLTDEDLEELSQAEDLAKQFLAWDLQEEDDGLLEQLRSMFVSVESEDVLEPGEGASGITRLEREAERETERDVSVVVKREPDASVVDLTED